MSQGRILAVDDQLYFRVFLEDLLEQEGYEVVTAGSAAEALSLVEGEKFDLILTDLVMPGMGGRELVTEVRKRRADQEIVVITSVGDVKTAVEAMKMGATDYLLKPIDRTALLRSIDTILERRAMKVEQDRLVAENLSYLGHFAQYERALGLFSTLTLEPLADRTVEVMCLETNAHGGVAWLNRPNEPETFRLTGAGGLVRIEEEIPEIVLSDLPERLAPLLDPRTGSLLVPSSTGRAQLFVPLRNNGQLLGFVRLSDRLDGADFDAADLEVAERFALFASQAVANAMAFRALERSSFRDPATRAYTRVYGEDAIHHELTKARRFGRALSVVRIRLDPISGLRSSLSADDFSRWLQGLVGELEGALRNTDLMSAESDHEFLVMLAECDSLGSVVAKRRLRSAVEQSAAMRDLDPEDRPIVLTAMATFPSNGTDLASLRSCLDRRIEEDRISPLRTYELESAPFQGLVETFLADASEDLGQLGGQMAANLLGEVARNPHHRGLLFLAPNAGRASGLREGLEQLRGANPRTDVVILADRDDEMLPGVPVTWVSPKLVQVEQPFLVYVGEGASYALIQEGAGEDGGVGSAAYHTSDPVVVEQMAFELSRDLGIPIGE